MAKNVTQMIMRTMFTFEAFSGSNFCARKVPAMAPGMLANNEHPMAIPTCRGINSRKCVRYDTVWFFHEKEREVE